MKKSDLWATAPRNYDLARPTYPTRVLDQIAANLEYGSGQVLDLGSGTQILTRALSARGLNLLAVDSSESMSSSTDIGAEYPTLIALGHRLPFKDESISGVVCGQAWHWMGNETPKELERVMNRHARLIILWQMETGRELSSRFLRRIRRVLQSSSTQPHHFSTTVPGFNLVSEAHEDRVLTRTFPGYLAYVASLSAPFPWQRWVSVAIAAVTGLSHIGQGISLEYRCHTYIFEKAKA